MLDAWLSKRVVSKDLFRQLTHPDRPAGDARPRAPDAARAARPSPLGRPGDRDRMLGVRRGEPVVVQLPPARAREVGLRRRRRSAARAASGPGARRRRASSSRPTASRRRCSATSSSRASSSACATRSAASTSCPPLAARRADVVGDARADARRSSRSSASGSRRCSTSTAAARSGAARGTVIVSFGAVAEP